MTLDSDLTERLQSYAASCSSGIGDLLQQLERETHLKTLAPAMLSGSLVGNLLRLFSQLLQPKTILEIGTFTGYGTLCLAAGLLPKGQLHSIEPNPEVLAIARKYVSLSVYAEQIVLHCGKAEDIIPNLEIPFFDLVYLDGGKRDYARHYDTIIERVRPGGLILADNVLWSGKVIQPRDKDARLMHQFNEKILADDRVENVLIPVRDGLMVIYRKNPEMNPL